MDVLFEVLWFDWTDDAMQADFEKKGASFHFEHVNVLGEFTPVSPSAVDAVVYCGSAKKMMRPEMKRYIDLYSSALLRIWLHNHYEDYDLDLLLRHRFHLSRDDGLCKKRLGQFFQQLSVFLTKLLRKLDLNDSKTVEYEDFVIYAEQLGVQLTPQDVEAFLREYEDEGDAFLTSRGILKWVKLGKRASPVGELILKVIQAKRLLNGFSMDIKRVFFEDAGRKTGLQGSINFSVGDCDFESAGARGEAHLWSRDRFPEQSPADMLQLSESDLPIVLSLTFPRREGRTFTQIQDFMCNIVFRLESVISLIFDGNFEALVNVDYRISDTTATLCLILNLKFAMAVNNSCKKDLRAWLNFFKSHVALEMHFSHESKAGLMDLWTNSEKAIHELFGKGTKTAFQYWFSSAARESLFSMMMAEGLQLIVFLAKTINTNVHFSTIDDLPEEVKAVLNAFMPKGFVTLADILNTVGMLINKAVKERSVEQQVELMMRTVADLFDMERIEATGQLCNFVARVKWHLPGLDHFLRLDIAAIRRKADDAKRAADAEGREADSSANDSGRNSVKMKRQSSQGSRKASLSSSEGSQIRVSVPVERRDSRKASIDSASDKSSRSSELRVIVPGEGGDSRKASIDSGNPPAYQASAFRIIVPDERSHSRRASIDSESDKYSGSDIRINVPGEGRGSRKASIDSGKPPVYQASAFRIIVPDEKSHPRRASIDSESDKHSDSEFRVIVPDIRSAPRRRSIERKLSISSGSQGSISD